MTPILENHMEKNMENNAETVAICKNTICVAWSRRGLPVRMKTRPRMRHEDVLKGSGV